MNGSQKMKFTGSRVAVAARCLRSSVGLREDMEVAVRMMLNGLLAVTVVAAVLVGGASVAKTGTVPRAEPSGRLSPVFARAGMMPEVVSTAEMPRLVMPTVEVHAFRTVAVSGTAGNVY